MNPKNRDFWCFCAFAQNSGAYLKPTCFLWALLWLWHMNHLVPDPSSQCRIVDYMVNFPLLSTCLIQTHNRCLGYGTHKHQKSLLDLKIQSQRKFCEVQKFWLVSLRFYLCVNCGTHKRQRYLLISNYWTWQYNHEKVSFKFFYWSNFASRGMYFVKRLYIWIDLSELWLTYHQRFQKHNHE